MSTTPRWKLGTIITIVLLVAVLVTVASLAAVTVRDTIVLKRAVEAAAGVSSGTRPPPAELALPAMPESSVLHVPFARFAADLVARLENSAATLTPPLTLEHLGTLSSESGKNNGWMLKTPDTDTLWLVFRGTATKNEWEKDFELRQVSFLARMMSRAAGRIAYPTLMDAPMRTNTNLFDPDIGVHAGFMDIYQSMRPLLLGILDRVDTARLCIAGHSMGAVMAQFASLDLGLTFPNLVIDTVVFGSPRAGNTTFARAMSTLTNLNSLVLLTNTCDMVGNVPLAVQPTLAAPYTALIYTHPGHAIHNFTDNRETWVANHTMGVYVDYLDSLINL